MLGIKMHLPETTTVGVIPYAQLRIGDLRWRKYRHIVASNKFSGQTINTTQLGSHVFSLDELPFSSDGAKQPIAD
jgi:hypothetical protein